MNPNQFRLRLLLDLFQLVAVPAIVFSLFLRLSHQRLGYLTVPAQLAFFIGWSFAKRSILDFQRHRNAEKLYTKQIPRVVGRWPGNVDVLVKMLKAFKKAYVLDVYLELFEEYQCTTLNLYIFWADQVCKVLSYV